MTIVHLNLYSNRNKFFDFKELALNGIEICLISETKIDDSFRNSQFSIDIYVLSKRQKQEWWKFNSLHEKNIVIGDFNMTVTAENSKMNKLMNNFSLENLIKEPTR